MPATTDTASAAVLSLDTIDELLAASRCRKLWYRHFVHRSAVALILRRGREGLEVLMIKRAERAGDPWSGHMAFPGGRAEKRDASNLHTARRETWEEIGLDTERFTRHHGRLSDLFAGLRRGRRPMVITPYLFSITELPDLAINQEVDRVIWVPLPFLAEHGNRRQMQWQGPRGARQLPCYFYREQRIWGLSLMMLDELIALLSDELLSLR